LTSLQICDKKDIIMDDNVNTIDFLNELQEGGLTLDEALQDYGHLLDSSEIEQAYLDYMDARSAIKKTLKRIARENDMQEALDYLD
jgi:hypothetical protein